MAQALVNSINNIQELGNSLKEGLTNADKNDFANILNIQTAKTENTTEVPEASDLKEEINDAIKEFSAEKVLDITILKDVFNNEETTEEDTDTDILPQPEITDNAEAIEPNITEEDPTMYNELNTLENPTAMILLNSQQLSVSVKNDNSLNETENEENSVLLTGKNNLNNTFELSKNFNDTNLKNSIPINAPQKESTSTKSENSLSNKTLDEKIIKELNAEVISQETENQESSGDIMQNQTPQEQAAKAMIRGDIKYENVVKEVVKATEVKPAEISSNKIIEQISKQLEGMYNNSKLNMVLNPGSLGKVNLQIINSKDGILAQFKVTTADARELLIKGLDGLKESLLAQGVAVDNVSIELEENETENNYDWTEQEGSRGGYKQEKKQKDGKNLFEQLMGTIDEENSANGETVA